MFWKISLVFIVILRSHVQCVSNFKQERAKVLYSNPKYVTNATIFTYRENRNSPYLTTCNFTTVTPMDNNVTIQFDLANVKMHEYPIKFEVKVCDGVNQAWLKDWLKLYSDIPLNKCPLPVADYHILKFELPAKSFPIRFTDGDFNCILTFYHTTTKEKIAQVSVTLRFDAKRGK